MAGAIESAREKMQKIMNAVNRIFFIARWIHAHGEIALLYAEDLTVLLVQKKKAQIPLSVLDFLMPVPVMSHAKNASSGNVLCPYWYSTKMQKCLYWYWHN